MQSDLHQLLVAERPALLAFLRRIGNVAEAEDHFQELALRAIRGQSTGVQDVRAWLYGIARNVARDRPRPLEWEHSVSQKDSVDQIHDDFLRSALLRCLENVDPENRALLIEHHAHQRSLAELETVTGVNQEALAARLARARRKIIAELSPDQVRFFADYDIQIPANIQTRIWCPKCADSPLDISHPADDTRLCLSCPRCEIRLFVAEGNAAYLFRGTPGVAISRFLKFTHHVFDQWRRDDCFHCPRCSSSGTVQVGKTGGYLACHCSICGLQSHHSQWEVALSSRDARQFWQKHSRIQEVIEQDRLVYISRRTYETLTVPLCASTGMPLLP